MCGGYEMLVAYVLQWKVDSKLDPCHARSMSDVADMSTGNGETKTSNTNSNKRRSSCDQRSSEETAARGFARTFR